MIKKEYWADFIGAPIFVAGATWMAFAMAPPLFSWIVLGLIGYCAWTLSEYIIHRWVLHKTFLKDHRLHHINPQRNSNHVGVQPWTVVAIAFVLWLFLVSVGGVGMGGALFVGYLIGYQAYISVHYVIHHTTGLIPVLRERHNIHHRGIEANFGVITTFWDEAFGTVAKTMPK